MKILIAYDGSACADAALADLHRAGLPGTAEALVLSVAERTAALPPPGVLMVQFDPYSVLTESHRALALTARQQLQRFFPGWNVRAESAAGSAAALLLARADEWKPDLVVLGSHGRSALGRFFFGSVSQRVVTGAHCTVRVARGRAAEAVDKTDAPVRLIIGVDSSSGAEVALRTVAARAWPAGSEARLVNAEFSVPPTVDDYLIGPFAKWLSDEREKLRLAVTNAESQLGAAGLTATSVIKESDPKQLLCAEAENWGADCIFVGARGLSRSERFRLGSVSTFVAARAHCSVEVVR